MRHLIIADQLRAFTDNRDDLSLGHVVVLLQYDWPQGEMMFLKTVDKICQQGSFQYENFFNYVTSILPRPQTKMTYEVFAYIYIDHWNLNSLANMCLSSHVLDVHFLELKSSVRH